MRALTRSASALVFAGIVTFVIVASGNAPPDEYVTFGPQATQIQDIHTHLLWQRVIAQTPTDWTTAHDSCTKNFQRLPTYRELLTLVDEDPHDEWDPVLEKSTPRYIDPNAFPGTPAGQFWTMSPSTMTKGTFKVVSFADGQTTDGQSTAYVRCVVDVP